MLNMIVSGAAGRMGNRIIALSRDVQDIKLSGALENKNHKDIGKDIGEVIGIGTTGIKLTGSIRDITGKADVLIDFSSTSATIECLKTLSEKPLPVVIGTTGFSKDEIGHINLYAQKVPCVLAPNMSVGVNLLLKVLADIARITGDEYDVDPCLSTVTDIPQIIVANYSRQVVDCFRAPDIIGKVG